MMSNKISSSFDCSPHSLCGYLGNGEKKWLSYLFLMILYKCFFIIPSKYVGGEILVYHIMLLGPRNLCLICTLLICCLDGLHWLLSCSMWDCLERECQSLNWEKGFHCYLWLVIDRTLGWFKFYGCVFVLHIL